jgi:hypothetical protein
MKFINEILGVHCKTTNAPCRANLGRQPLWTKTQFSSMKFWNHLITFKNTLAFEIYKTMAKTNSWTKIIFFFNFQQLRVFMHYEKRKFNKITSEKHKTKNNRSMLTKGICKDS